MPIYLYFNPETHETREVLQGMNEIHAYHEDGVDWQRVFTIPTASIDTKINPFSSSDFVNKTANKRGTVGEVMDLSAELSEKRAQSDGKEDPVKRKLFSDYEKKNKGAKHLADKPKRVETKGAIIDF